MHSMNSVPVRADFPADAIMARSSERKSVLPRGRTLGEQVAAECDDDDQPLVGSRRRTRVRSVDGTR
ncbi:hypothetical protein PLANTIT3_61391 [Plantibacter sp. T3]|nr:hypothetical protein PLANTIT3_61391 [Plantibacter sp. T3]